MLPPVSSYEIISYAVGEFIYNYYFATTLTIIEYSLLEFLSEIDLKKWNDKIVKLFLCYWYDKVTGPLDL